MEEPMEIRAAGRVWDVETAASRSIAAGEDFCGVVFRDRADREAEVAIGWVPRARLTSYQATRLFQLAGERLWRDPRTEVIHRVLLEDAADGVGDSLSVRFQTAAGSCATRYDLTVSLGMAEDEDLARLLDRALKRGPGRLGAD
jgi:hypothetical protein